MAERLSSRTDLLETALDSLVEIRKARKVLFASRLFELSRWARAAARKVPVLSSLGIGEWIIGRRPLDQILNG